MQIQPFVNKSGPFTCLMVLQFLLFSMAAYADGGADCPRAETKGADGRRIVFQQHWFADGSTDLALIPQNGGDMDVKRVTYDGGKTEACLYRSVAIAPGGSDEQWGWHMAWAGEEGVRYARMDGEAWVSSPPKRLSTASASELRFQTNGSELVLRWREQSGVYQATSHDEGRTWEQPQQVQAAD